MKTRSPDLVFSFLHIRLVPMGIYLFLYAKWCGRMEIVPGEILNSFKKGDENAFRYYYEMYYDALCLLGIRMLKDEDAALDIVQDVFVNLWKAREGIESELHLKMYTYQSMRHRCLNYIRVKKLDADYRNEFMVLASEGDFANVVVEEEVYRLVMEEIDRLPQEQRRVLLMHLEGKNNIEIAELMEISVNTVKTHKARARQQLKVKLNDFFIFSVIIGL